jgi:hypothetical protein
VSWAWIFTDCKREKMINKKIIGKGIGCNPFSRNISDFIFLIFYEEEFCYIQTDFVLLPLFK